MVFEPLGVLMRFDEDPSDAPILDLSYMDAL